MGVCVGGGGGRLFQGPAWGETPGYLAQKARKVLISAPNRSEDDKKRCSVINLLTSKSPQAKTQRFTCRFIKVLTVIPAMAEAS